MFEQYLNKNGNHGNCSFFYKVPIELLDEFRQAYPAVFKIRYRGPRKNDIGRSPNSKQTTCLKQNAKYFSAYRY
jgi:hypothetical protein